MINSIQHFCSEGVKKLEKVMIDYAGDMTKIAEMVEGVTKGVTALGCSMIAEEWESYDELLRKRKSLRSEWYIVRVAGLLGLVVWLVLLSNYNLFSKIKAFGDFSESLFTLRNNSKMLCGSNMVLKNLFIRKLYQKYLLIVLYWNIK